jgi:purine-binding chemotaxis protein CheW
MAATLLLESNRPTDQTRQYITFWIENKRFGICILDVKEIYSDLVITPVFHAAEDIRGYINIRGEIYLVADLRKILGLQKNFINVEEKLIIFKDLIYESFGIVVDRISDVITINDTEIEKFSTDEGGEMHESYLLGNEHKIVGGICKHEAGLIILLDGKTTMQSILAISKASQVQ